MAPLPVAKSGNSAAIINNEIVVIGGKELLEIILYQKFLILMEKYGDLLVYFQKIFMDLELLVFKIKYCYVEGIINNKPTRNCWIYDHSLSNWAQINDMPYARARSCHGKNK